MKQFLATDVWRRAANEALTQPLTLAGIADRGDPPAHSPAVQTLASRASLGTEGDHRVDASGTPGGNGACNQGHPSKD
jgi:hypothetical protein